MKETLRQFLPSLDNQIFIGLWLLLSAGIVLAGLMAWALTHQVSPGCGCLGGPTPATRGSQFDRMEQDMEKNAYSPSSPARRLYQASA